MVFPCNMWHDVSPPPCDTLSPAPLLCVFCSSEHVRQVIFNIYIFFSNLQYLGVKRILQPFLFFMSKRHSVWEWEASEELRCTRLGENGSYSDSSGVSPKFLLLLRVNLHAKDSFSSLCTICTLL
ncbi:hypothetical protein Naga_100450g2 [Nannochloropsis gaditana]|uniref:Uncharacterized protein n=1 Tax=Nannochloropsis gaditana TaxID=72520 RepID=W7T1L3_9STRA|nr:hypothetical protein Naga_100450g2 [Nannochloropsis gaditana]